MTPLRAAALDALPGIRHGFFTRRGGISRGPFASANMGLRSGDLPANVRENRARAARALGLDGDALVTAFQVHGTDCAIVEHAWPPAEAPDADALVCDRPGVAIGVLSADCAPVLFADASAGRVAAAHAGWRGLLAGVLERTLEAMCGRGSRLADIRVAIGPCIGPSSYEVGEDLEAAFVAADAASARFFRSAPAAGKRLFDLAGCARRRLEHAGVARTHIALMGHDTFAEPDRFFSYRRSCQQGEKRFGVQLSAIALVGS